MKGVKQRAKVYGNPCSPTVGHTLEHWPLAELQDLRLHPDPNLLFNQCLLKIPARFGVEFEKP